MESDKQKIQRLERQVANIQRTLDSWTVGDAFNIRASRILQNNLPLTDASNLGIYKNVRNYGARADGRNDYTAIQTAISSGGVIYFPAGIYVYDTPLEFTQDNTRLLGESRLTTQLAYSGTAGPAIKSSTEGSAVRKYCAISDMVVRGLSCTGNIIDWRSMQSGLLQNIHINGDGLGGTATGVIMGSSGSVDCTYNRLENSYIALCKYGILLGTYANANTITNWRIQPCVSGGWGIKISGTANANLFLADSIEYTSGGDGILVTDTADGNTLVGCRFEGQPMAIGIQIDSGALHTVVVGPYFSGVTTQYTDAGTDTVVVYEGLLAASATATRGLSITSTNTNYLQKELMIATTTDSGVSNTALSISGNLDLKGSSSNIFINGQYAMKARITGMGSALTASTAGAAYGGTEQTMLQDAHDAIRLLMAACKNHGFVAT